LTTSSRQNRSSTVSIDSPLARKLRAAWSRVRAPCDSTRSRPTTLPADRSRASEAHGRTRVSRATPTGQATVAKTPITPCRHDAIGAFTPGRGVSLPFAGEPRDGTRAARDLGRCSLPVESWQLSSRRKGVERAAHHAGPLRCTSSESVLDVTSPLQLAAGGKRAPPLSGDDCCPGRRQEPGVRQPGEVRPSDPGSPRLHLPGRVVSRLAVGRESSCRSGSGTHRTLWPPTHRDDLHDGTFSRDAAQRAPSPCAQRNESRKTGRARYWPGAAGPSLHGAPVGLLVGILDTQQGPPAPHRASPSASPRPVPHRHPRPRAGPKVRRRQQPKRTRPCRGPATRAEADIRDSRRGDQRAPIHPAGQVHVLAVPHTAFRNGTNYRTRGPVCRIVGGAAPSPFDSLARTAVHETPVSHIPARWRNDE
jgi:hypothetical protein